VLLAKSAAAGVCLGHVPVVDVIQRTTGRLRSSWQTLKMIHSPAVTSIVTILMDFRDIGLNCGDRSVWSNQALLSAPGLWHDVPVNIQELFYPKKRLLLTSRSSFRSEGEWREPLGSRLAACVLRGGHAAADGGYVFPMLKP
jgi:hypothetical protein